MGERIVGYVISHTGKLGGPWEANGMGAWGESTPHADKRRVVWDSLQSANIALPEVVTIHPAARILRLVRRPKCDHIPDDVEDAHCNKCGAWLGNGTTALCTRAPEGWSCSRALGHTGPCAAVRRERHRAEEAAVVEAALRAHIVSRDGPQYWAALHDLDAACAALRAKRGG